MEKSERRKLSAALQSTESDTDELYDLLWTSGPLGFVFEECKESQLPRVAKITIETPYSTRTSIGDSLIAVNDLDTRDYQFHDLFRLMATLPKPIRLAFRRPSSTSDVILSPTAVKSASSIATTPSMALQSVWKKVRRTSFTVQSNTGENSEGPPPIDSSAAVIHAEGDGGGATTSISGKLLSYVSTTMRRQRSTPIQTTNKNDLYRKRASSDLGHKKSTEDEEEEGSNNDSLVTRGSDAEVMPMRHSIDSLVGAYDKYTGGELEAVTERSSEASSYSSSSSSSSDSRSSTSSDSRSSMNSTVSSSSSTLDVSDDDRETVRGSEYSIDREDNLQYEVTWESGSSLGLFFAEEAVTKRPVVTRHAPGNSTLTTAVNPGDMLISANGLESDSVTFSRFFSELQLMEKPVTLCFLPPDYYAQEEDDIITEEEGSHIVFSDEEDDEEVDDEDIGSTAAKRLSSSLSSWGRSFGIGERISRLKNSTANIKNSSDEDFLQDENIFDDPSSEIEEEIPTRSSFEKRQQELKQNVVALKKKVENSTVSLLRADNDDALRVQRRNQPKKKMLLSEMPIIDERLSNHAALPDFSKPIELKGKTGRTKFRVGETPDSSTYVVRWKSAGNIGIKVIDVQLAKGVYPMVQYICREDCCKTELAHVLVGDLLLEINGKSTLELGYDRTLEFFGKPRRSAQLRFKHGPRYSIKRIAAA